MQSVCGVHRRCCDVARPNAPSSRPVRPPQVAHRLCVARAASEAPADAELYTGDTPGTVYGDRGEVEKVRSSQTATMCTAPV